MLGSVPHLTLLTADINVSEVHVGREKIGGHLCNVAIIKVKESQVSQGGKVSRSQLMEITVFSQPMAEEEKKIDGGE